MELSQVEYFIDIYSAILPFNSDSALMERLNKEFISYQLLKESDVPADVWRQAAIYLLTPKEQRTIYEEVITTV